MLSRYLDRNESIGVVQELCIRAAMSRHNKQELIDEVEGCGIPVAGEILRIVREEIARVEWGRQFELLDYLVVLGVWKAVLGSGFRPIFFQVLLRLLEDVDPSDLIPYLRDPKDWRVNVYARRKHVRDKSL